MILNAAGCDSTITIDLTIGNLNFGTDFQVACESYTWIDGFTYTFSTNTPLYLLSNVYGCDSFVTLNLTIINSDYITEITTACDSYTWPADGNIYDHSGTYTTTLTNAQGCDSVITLNLTIANSNAVTETATACDSYTWPADGNIYDHSGTYTTTLANAQGCDSVITLNLTIANSNAVTETATACDSYTWPADGNIYNHSGTYTANLANAQGCDSVITLNLTIANSSTVTETATACDSYTWAADGNIYNHSGTYTTTLANAHGCDSVITLNLTIANSSTVTETATACDSYTWAADGNTYDMDGEYTTTLTNLNGCDSMVTLNLIINSVSDLTTSVNGTTISANNSIASYEWLDCDNDYAVINGETSQSFTPQTNGNYAVQLTENGCIDTTECIAVTLVEVLEDDFGNDLIVYPNPTNGELLIDLGRKHKTVAISIIDLKGKVIQSKSFLERQVLNLTIIEPSGVYLLKIKSSDKVAIRRLIIVNVG